MSYAGALIGAWVGSQVQMQKDIVKALKKGAAISSQSAKTLTELGLDPNRLTGCLKGAEGFVSMEKELSYLIKRGRVLRVGDKLYLNDGNRSWIARMLTP